MVAVVFPKLELVDMEVEMLFAMEIRIGCRHHQHPLPQQSKRLENKHLNSRTENTLSTVIHYQVAE